LGRVRAHELAARAAPDVHALVERLAVRTGVAKPKLYLIEKGPPLALSAGRGAHSATIAVTEALLLLPSPAEVEAVLAHEFAHIRRRDVLVQTAAVVLAALIVETSRVGGWLERWLLFVLRQLASGFVQLPLCLTQDLAASAL